MAAGTELATAYVSLTISANKIAPQVNREFGAVEKQAQRSGAQAGENFASGYESRTRRLAAAMKVGVLAAGGLLTAAATVGVKTAAANEQAAISFTTMLGSGKKAASFLNDLKSFAAKTPFEFPELQRAASSLISAGVEAKKVVPIMTTLGDVTSGMGTGAGGVQRATIALQQMNAAGKITGEDLNQLRDAGVPVYDLLAAATGRSKAAVTELASKGKLGAKDLGLLMKALETGKGLERFTGLMDKQSQSLSGMASTFKDTFSQGMADAVQPLIPVLKDGLGLAISFTAAQMPKLRDGIAGVMENLPKWKALFGQAVLGAKGLYDLVVKGDFSGKLREAFGWEEDSPIVGQILSIRDGVVKTIESLKGADKGGAVSGIFANLGSGARSLVDTLPALKPLTDAAASTMKYLADNTDLVAKALPFLVAAFVAYKTAQAANNVVGRDSLVGFAAQLVTSGLLIIANNRLASSTTRVTVAQRAQLASTVSGNVAENVSLLTRVRTTAATVASTVATKAAAVASKVMAAGQWLVNAALTANPIGLVVAAIAGLVAIVVLAYKKNETFRAIVDAAWKGVKAAISGVVDWFRNTAWPWMRNAFQWIGDKAGWLWSTIIKPYFTAMWTLWKTVFTFLRDTVWPIARDAFANIATKGKWLWVNVLKPTFDAIKKGVGLAADAFSVAKDNIGRAWSALEGLAKKPIRFIIDTVLNKGLIAGFNWLSGKIGGPNIGNIPLPKGFATGGVLPGYTPGRDVHRFYSPTGGRLDLSGGEAIMRPEFTRLVGGKAGVDRLNAMARAGNVPMQAFAGGGVVNWLKSKGGSALDWALKKAGAVWDAMKDPAKYLLDKLPSIPGGSALAGMGGAVKDKLVGLAAAKVKELFSSFSSALSQEQAAKAASSVGGMYSGKGGGGNALNRVRGMLIPGTQVTSTYRSPGRNAAVGGSRTSYHMDARNPAVDIGGATAALDRLYPILRAAGGWRELIWRAPGHYDHIHAAKDGGVLPKPLLFDRGGILPMGTSLVRNDTGAPEPLARVGHDSGRREPLVVNLVLPDGRVLTSAVIDDLGGRR